MYFNDKGNTNIDNEFNEKNLSYLALILVVRIELLII